MQYVYPALYTYTTFAAGTGEARCGVIAKSFEKYEKGSRPRWRGGGRSRKDESNSELIATDACRP